MRTARRRISPSFAPQALLQQRQNQGQRGGQDALAAAKARARGNRIDRLLRGIAGDPAGTEPLRPDIIDPPEMHAVRVRKAAPHERLSPQGDRVDNLGTDTLLGRYAACSPRLAISHIARRQILPSS
jgi:hypothetical protein